MATIAPSVPSNLAAQQGNGQVWLTFSQVASASAGYLIQRSLDNITFTALGTSLVPNYLDTTVTVGVEYWYKVAASNGVVSAYSNSVSVVPTQPGQMTLGQLRLLSQQKADRVNSNFVTMSEWNVYINNSLYELYDLLIQKYGNDYFVAQECRFNLTGSYQYQLPDGILPFIDINNSPFVAKPFYKLLGVDLAINPNNQAWITLGKFNFIERNSYVYPQLGTNLLGIAGLRYRMEGNLLWFIPTPQSGQMARIWYIPRLTTLLKDTDLAEGVSGWLEYVAVDAAIKALQKEESDVTVLAAQKMALIQRIEAAAENRDPGIPDTVSQTRRNVDLYGAGFPFGGMPFGGF